MVTLSPRMFLVQCKMFSRGSIDGLVCTKIRDIMPSFELHETFVTGLGKRNHQVTGAARRQFQVSGNVVGLVI